ncbi:Glucosamine 6-phosphate N-acetyltransferase [Striga hermonthica]|uniref:Glucosamine 6-phosphate N-acetyltransferase n=1 Tax=Striga hermonthica TaxID=68872 RepID=A0A9N7MZ19_STRHE|nr:Glucosamine 6-phosphate N-acetyltransferase [Striga hermonthica]
MHPVSPTPFESDWWSISRADAAAPQSANVKPEPPHSPFAGPSYVWNGSYFSSSDGIVGAFHGGDLLFRSSSTSFYPETGKKMNTTSSSIEDETFQVRKLEITDKQKGFIELLQQLTVCGPISDEAFKQRFQEIARYGDDHIICVVEDCSSSKIVGTGSVFVEKKFIRNCGKVGHIEDVVVDSGVRGKQLGKKIVGFLSDHAREMGCYKVILDCSVDNRAFYERCGFKQKEVQMVKYFI